MALDYSNPRSPMLELMIELSEEHGRKWIPSKVLRAACKKRGRRYAGTTMNNLVKAGQVEKLKKGDYKLAPVSFRLKQTTEETKRSYRKWQQETKSKNAKHNDYMDELINTDDEDIARAVIEKKTRATMEPKIEASIERQLEEWRSLRSDDAIDEELNEDIEDED